MPRRYPTPHGPASLFLLGAIAGTLALPVLGQDQPEDQVTRAEREKAEQEGVDLKAQEAAKAAKEAERLRAQPQPQLPPGKQVPGAAQPGRTSASPVSASQPGAAGAAGSAAGKQPPISVSGGAAQPGQAGAGAQPLKPDEISLSKFSEGMDLKLLVEFVADELQINVVASDALQGNIVLNAPVVVKKSELLPLLDALLEQHGHTIIPDNQSGFYKVIPIEGVSVVFESDRATTRVIHTPTIRPSSLAEAINTQIGGFAVTAPGQPAAAGGRGRLTYLDDLGVIIVTDSPRRIELIEQLVNVIMARAGEQQYIRFSLEHISASTARTRLLELVGKPQNQGLFPQQPVPQQVPGMLIPGGANFDNLSDRLSADAQSNALILRGYPEEETKIKTLLAILDQPNALEYKQYFAGSAALQIAQLAERFGFGTVETVETTATQNQANPGQPGAIRPQQPQNPFQMGPQQGTIGGPVLVVDPSRGNIAYNGTASQQAAIERLISSFNPQLEIVEFRAYKIKNMPATEMSDLLTGLIFNEEVSRTDSSSFLPGSSRREQGGQSYRDRMGSSIRNRDNQRSGDTRQNVQPMSTGTQRSTTPRVSGGPGGRGPIALTGQPTGDGVAAIGSQDVFLLPDEANNQVVVKATARDHEQIGKLITKLDQRRPQVYIEVQIVSVSAIDDFRLAFEVQAVGNDGGINTNFGLGTFGATLPGGGTSNGNFVGPKSIITTLAGLTAAVVRSDQVPIIMTALKRNADTRILSSPQLLVDDNEFAEIVALEEQPTTTTDVGTSTSLTSFGGYESAGTTLSVTPSISEGGYMRLEYEIELSTFVGAPSASGLPPAKQTRNVSSTSVTIPGNATIVVGGIKVDVKNTTIAKVPLVGDIPLIKWLFRDTNKNNLTTRLYVFITPRIMRDVNFGDSQLLTRGPAEEAGIEPDTPPLMPIMIEMNELPRSSSSAPQPPAKPEESQEGTKP